MRRAENMKSAIIFDIKEMAVHDGPGIRTTVFFKGCPLRCIWCHNPEGLSSEIQLMYKKARCTDCRACYVECTHEECQALGRCIHRCPNNCLTVSGEIYTKERLIKRISEYYDMMGSAFGGVTFSGGEPLVWADFLCDLIDGLGGMHTCIETSGYAPSHVFRHVVDKVDFVIMDLKLADDELHKKYTGVSNGQILENFEYLKKSKKPYVIRTPLIPDITDTKENLSALARIIGDATWEKLPYNSMAGAKYEMLGMKFEM